MKNLESLHEHFAGLPDDVRSNAQNLIERMGSVIEGVGDEGVEWRAPLLKLLQATSDRTGLPRGTAPGSLILGEEVLEVPTNFIPIRVYDQRQFWDPDMSQKRMLCQSPDALLGQIGKECRVCPHSQWVEGSGTDCNKIHTVLAITADLKEVFTMNFAKSQYKVGTEYKATLKKAGVVPYARTYGLSSETSPTTKTVEQFKIEALAADKRKTPEALIPFLKALFDLVSADRKQLLTDFYKSIEDRRAAGTLPIGVAGAPQIEDASAGDATLQIPAEEGATAVATKVSPKAKGYQV
jgi:hypothetical protein